MIAVLYGSTRPAAEGCPGSQEECTLQVSRSALIARMRPRHRPVLHRRLVRAVRPRSAASSEALNTDYKACVAFDTGGLGDKGFNDLAKKGLDDAKALGYKTVFSRGAGRHRLRGATSSGSSTRAARRSSRSASCRPGHGEGDRSPTRRSPSGRSTRRGTRRAPTSTPAPPTIRLRASRRTSPASTTRSTRRDARRLPRRELQQVGQGRRPTAAWPSRA